MVKKIETKKGFRYYQFSLRAMRWLPIKAAEAEYLISSQQVELVSADTL